MPQTWCSPIPESTWGDALRPITVSKRSPVHRSCVTATRDSGRAHWSSSRQYRTGRAERFSNDDFIHLPSARAGNGFERPIQIERMVVYKLQLNGAEYRCVLPCYILLQLVMQKSEENRGNISFCGLESDTQKVGACHFTVCSFSAESGLPTTGLELRSASESRAEFFGETFQLLSVQCIIAIYAARRYRQHGHNSPLCICANLCHSELAP